MHLPNMKPSRPTLLQNSPLTMSRTKPLATTSAGNNPDVSDISRVSSGLVSSKQGNSVESRPRRQGAMVLQRDVFLDETLSCLYVMLGMHCTAALKNPKQI